MPQLESTINMTAASHTGPDNDPLRPGQTLRVALLSNPASGRNRQGMDKIRGILAAHPEVAHYEAHSPEEISTALNRMRAHAPDVLAINSGDGTIAATLTALFNERPFSQQPLLALLRGGTTNMTAGDVGMHGNARQALQKLLRWARAVDPDVALRQRAPLRVQTGPDMPPMYGMFFGAGAIIGGIEYCHRKILRPGMRDGFGPALCTLRMLIALARGDRRYVAPVNTRISSHPALTHDGQTRDYFILMASALERLFLGSHPYWGENQGAFHYTAIQSHARHALWTIPAIFWGRGGRRATADNGYWSRKLDCLQLEMSATFTIDGELYPLAGKAGPLHISSAAPTRFLCF